MSVKHANNCPKMDDDSEVSKSVHILSGNGDADCHALFFSPLSPGGGKGD